MPIHLKLVGHYEQQVRGGVAVGALSQDVTVGDGDTVQVPILFSPISDHLAVAPAIAADGAHALRVDLTRWAPMRYGPGASVVFALNFIGLDLATRVARALDADPRASWHWPAQDARTWCRLHADRLGIRL